MRLSVKSDYAARAVLGLAGRFDEGVAVRSEDLASEQAIPVNYLAQILIELKAKGIVKSLRGKEGGYMLARPPGEISLGDILRAVHGQVFDTPAFGDTKCAPELRNAWHELRKAFEASADAITFQRLIEAGREKEKMYYI